MSYYGINYGKGGFQGVVQSWSRCAELTQGVSGAIFKKFDDKSKAKYFAQTGEEPDPEAKPGKQKTRSSKRDSNPSEVVDVYVDGSCKDDGFGWAFVVEDEGDLVFEHKDGAHESELGEVAGQANVTAEMKAAMCAARWAEKQGVKIRLHCDYKGLIKWARKQWDRNNEFTSAYADYMWSKQDYIEELIKVKGHAGVHGNEQADKLAGIAATSAKSSESAFGEPRQVA